MTPDRLAAGLEAKAKTANDPDKFLRQMVFSVLQSCAGSFLHRTGDYARRKLGSINPDVIAFEGLALCCYLTREHHLPTPADWGDDRENEQLVDAYRSSIGYMPRLVAELTGWEVDTLWERRIMHWFTRKSMRDATEDFAGLILTMNDVQRPDKEYGRLSLDLAFNLELRAHLNAFAATIPKVMADGIQSAISEYGLVH